ncbi:hypothetical protein ABEQ76_10440 [Bacillus velezensis]
MQDLAKQYQYMLADIEAKVQELGQGDDFKQEVKAHLKLLWRAE